MKTILYILTLAVLMALATGVQARTFEQGEKIYLNADQSQRDGDGKFNWNSDNAKFVLYIWKKGVTGSQKWVSMDNESGNIFVGDIPAGDFNRCIVLRKSPSHNTEDFSNWNRAGDITIPDDGDRNYLEHFWAGDKEDAGSDWLTYIPSTSKIGDFIKDVTEEQVHICSQSLGGPYSLRVKLKDGGKEYDYGNVQCHGWYKSTDGTNWESVDGYAGMTRDGEKDKDILKNNLPESGSEFYYYLHSSKAAGRRLIKLTPDAKDCDLTCKITAFEVATSAVNANDTTYTLDGMVAFGTATGYGDLVIECDGKKATIKEQDAKSPQIFSIEGLPAATTNGVKREAKAYFTKKNQEGWLEKKTFDVPNATQGIVRTHIDVLVGESAALNPKGANYQNDHKWFVNGVEKPEMKGAQNSIVFNEPNTTNYTYREFKTPPDDMKDMMANGGYEDKDFNYGEMGKKSTISDYDFWDKYDNATTKIDFYENEAINPKTGNPEHPITYESNGFAVVQSAYNFFYTFAQVTPQEGEYFALFDAASDGVAGKKAWLANTEKNTNLKLQKGTTYLFSFWAANINNYGEMDNAAVLQFQIEYNGNTQKLGEPLDLGSDEFRNNRWHQCSATFTADADADNVTISVINLNTNRLITGNDFALDDIQFRAVSSPTHSVKIQEVITVQTHEPHIYKMTATAKSMPCDERKYEVSISVEYDNPKGKLVVKDLTANKTVFEGAVPTDHGDWDQKKTKTISYTIDDNLDPAKHEYKAYFDGWTKAEAAASSTAPDYVRCPEVITLTADTLSMECDETSYEVKFSLEYVNPKGNLIIKDVTSGKIVVNEALPVSAVNSEASYEKTVTIDGLNPEMHEYKAYFAEWTTQFATASTTSPVFTECCVNPDGLIYRKWRNVLFVNNHDSIYVAYQWYRDNVKLEGDTLQRLYSGAGVENEMADKANMYHCVITTNKGETIETCPRAFNDFKSSAEASKESTEASVSVRPTRVAAGAGVVISKTTEEAMTATLRTLTGQLIRAAELRDSESTMLMPNNAGIYLLQLQGKETQTTVKINVY